MMRRWSLAGLAVLVCLVACAPRTLVVVFPDSSGDAGAVTLEDGEKSVVLDKPYAAGEVRGGNARAAEVEPDEAREIFADALGAQPIPPKRFTLYFEFETDQLTPEAKERYREVLADVVRRRVPEVEAIGYTDTVGAQRLNQRLSLQRAKMVRTMLKRDGVTAPISVAGRGKLDPAVPTGDQVNEARNRRVVVTVR